ncbi:unnamed protein product [Caenorhabditis brenneri]
MPCRVPFFSPFHSLRIKKVKREKPPNRPKGFPLSKLPHFPLKDIINQLEFVDVIYLTMKYKRFKRAVESAKFHVDQFHFHLSKFTKKVAITHQGREIEIDSEYKENNNGSTGLKLNGIATPICYSRLFGMKVFAESEEAKMDLLEKITQHFLSILWVRTFTARFLIKCDFENLFIWKYTKKLGQLNIDPLVNTELVLSPRELHFFLEDIKIDEPVLKVKVENDYKYPNYPLQSSIVYLSNLNFIDLDKLTIGPDCVIFSMTNGDILNACGNRLLKEWIAGKNEKLEKLSIRVEEWFEDENNNKDVFDGITTTVTTFSEKQLDKRGVWTVGLRPLLDIRRSTDGRVGTISRWKTWVYLTVWHPKHMEELEKESK